MGIRQISCATLIALLMAQSAFALATIDFMKMEPSDQMAAVKPIMIGFLQRGFKRIPNNEWTLIAEMKRLAFEKGYNYQNMETVAEEAAVRLGMTR